MRKIILFVVMMICTSICAKTIKLDDKTCDKVVIYADSVKQTSTSKTVILREANKINGENCMYHPFSNIKNFDVKYEYIL